MKKITKRIMGETPGSVGILCDTCNAYVHGNTNSENAMFVRNGGNRINLYNAPLKGFACIILWNKEKKKKNVPI